MNIELTEEEASMFRAMLKSVRDIESVDGYERVRIAELIALLTPPPPPLPEPTKFGAIVKDDDELLWSFVDATDTRSWRSSDGDWLRFSDIKNPTLIFEGVDS